MGEVDPMESANQQTPSLPPEAPKEEELLERLRRGGQAALASELFRHRDRLRRMIEVRLDPRLVNQVDPSEVLERTFLEAASRLDEYLANPPMPLSLWFRYLTGQQIAAIHREYLGQQGGSEPPEQFSPKPEASESKVSREAGDSACLQRPISGHRPSQDSEPLLSQLLRQLEPLDREILRLRHLEQLTNAETAGQLGLSPAVASQRYIQALDRLREAWNRRQQLPQR